MYSSASKTVLMSRVGSGEIRIHRCHASLKTSLPLAEVEASSSDCFQAASTAKQAKCKGSRQPWQNTRMKLRKRYRKRKRITCRLVQCAERVVTRAKLPGCVVPHAASWGPGSRQGHRPVGSSIIISIIIVIIIINVVIIYIIIIVIIIILP